jgi:hypothetical protein
MREKEKKHPSRVLHIIRRKGNKHPSSCRVMYAGKSAEAPGIAQAKK